MSDVLYLAVQYLRFNRGKTTVLAASISLILFLPAGLQVTVERTARALTARADATPLLIGAPGSAVDLTLASLYFRRPSVEPLSYEEVGKLDGSGLGSAIPLHLRFEARGHRIVGTSPDYFKFRNLEIAVGRRFAMLGECVIGAKAASALGATTGSFVMSTPSGAFDVAGSFPLKMKVVGVLAPSGTPDDDAILVDLKTAWVIAGLAHGHTDVTMPGAESGVLARSDDNVVANASVLSYTEITSENIDSFHFHGDPAGFPVDSIIVVPRDHKSGVVLRGRYGEPDSGAQMIVPRGVVDDLVATMFSVRDIIFAVGIAMAVATIATVVLIFALSIRYRRREIETMWKIGAAPGRIRAILATEILLVIVASVVIAGALTALVSRFGLPALNFIN